MNRADLSNDMIDDDDDEIQDESKDTDEDMSRLLLEVTRYNKSAMEEKHVNYSVLKKILDEYLDSYIIMGYSPNGDDYILRKADSPKDRRALTHLAEELFTGQIRLTNGDDL